MTDIDTAALRRLAEAVLTKKGGVRRVVDIAAFRDALPPTVVLALCDVADEVAGLREENTKLRAALAMKVSAMPEEWKLVPVEPTDEMYRKIADLWNKSASENYGQPPDFDSIWDEALAASELSYLKNNK